MSIRRLSNAPTRFYSYATIADCMTPKTTGRIKDVAMNDAGGLEGVVVELIREPGAGTVTARATLETNEGYETEDGNIPQDRVQGVTVRDDGLPYTVRFSDVQTPAGTEDAVVYIGFNGQQVGRATRDELEEIAERDPVRKELETIRVTQQGLKDRQDRLENRLDNVSEDIDDVGDAAGGSSGGNGGGSDDETTVVDGEKPGWVGFLNEVFGQ